MLAVVGELEEDGRPIGWLIENDEGLWLDVGVVVSGRCWNPRGGLIGDCTGVLDP